MMRNKEELFNDRRDCKEEVLERTVTDDSVVIICQRGIA
jgi:hypothetical protein